MDKRHSGVPFFTNAPNCSPKPYTSSPGDKLSSEFMYLTIPGSGAGVGLEAESSVKQELLDADDKVHREGTSNKA